MTNPFLRTENARPERSRHNLSRRKTFPLNFGEIHIVYCRRMIPGDKFKLSYECIVRNNPMIAPYFHETWIDIHAYFVPERICDPEFEFSITGGEDGLYPSNFPRWKFNPYPPGQPSAHRANAATTGIGTIWEDMGFPIYTTANPSYVEAANILERPSDFPRRAYNLIWDEYYRDENLQDRTVPVITTGRDWPNCDNYSLLVRNLSKDYFYSALPFQQRGKAPGLSVSGFLPIDWFTPQGVSGDDQFKPIEPLVMTGTRAVWQNYTGGSLPDGQASPLYARNPIGNAPNSIPSVAAVNLENSVGFSISDLRLAVQIQKFLERNARSGVRYTEFLKAHFNTSPRDDRLQRPEYIGGGRQFITNSEVLQTSSTDTTSPQGNMSGHGISADTGYIGNIYAAEYGLIMVLASILPKPAYSQRIDREWLYNDRYDYPNPVFAHLSEQGIKQGEIYYQFSQSASPRPQDGDLFGYQGIYDELRTDHDQVTGLMRPEISANLSFWHLARSFSSPPPLNGDLIKCNWGDYNRAFIIQSEPQFLCTIGISNDAVRPIPEYATPGYVDHF